MDRMAFMGGGSYGAPGTSGSLHWCLPPGLSAFLKDGKSLERIPRLSSDSHDRYMAWTELLT